MLLGILRLMCLDGCWPVACVGAEAGATTVLELSEGVGDTAACSLEWTVLTKRWCMVACSMAHKDPVLSVAAQTACSTRCAPTTLS